jgi:two-component system response regulator
MGDYQNMPDFEGANKFQAATAWVFSLIPVIVLTTSTSEEDIIKSYEIKANCYITKPVVLDQFTAIVQPITPFWSTIVTLPEGW